MQTYDSTALVKTLRHTHIHTSSFKKVPCCLLSGVSSEELCRCFSDVLKMLPRTDSVAFKNSGSVPSEPSNPFKRAFTQGHITQYLSECHHRLLFNCGPVFSGLKKKGVWCSKQCFKCFPLQNQCSLKKWYILYFTKIHTTVYSTHPVMGRFCMGKIRLRDMLHYMCINSGKEEDIYMSATELLWKILQQWQNWMSSDGRETVQKYQNVHWLENLLSEIYLAWTTQSYDRFIEIKRSRHCFNP